MKMLKEIDLSGELGVPRSTLAVWRHRGQGPAYMKVGRHVRYAREDVEAWLASRRHDPSSRVAS